LPLPVPCWRHRQGVEYGVDHHVTPDGTERLLILHNDGAENFELATAPLGDRPPGGCSCHTAPTPACSASTHSVITWSCTSAGTG
jgi:oligopeptidase B